MFKTITTLGAAALIAVGLTTAQAQTYVPNTTFGGIGTALNQFNNPKGVSIAPDGKIFVVEYQNHRISVWTQSGNNFGNLTTFGGLGTLFYPSGVTVAADGKIFIANSYMNQISVWTQSGNTFGFLSALGAGGAGSAAANRFNFPAGVTVADGKIYVSEFNNNRISVWTQSGNTFGNLTTFGGIGSGANEFIRPYGVTVASDGKIFVADQANHRISVWTQSGNTFGNLTTFGIGTSGSSLDAFNQPADVKIFDNKIFVSDAMNNRISVWTQSGNTFGNLTTFGGTGSALSKFDFPQGISVATDGKIYVSDVQNNRISVWQSVQPQTISGFTIPATVVYGSTISGLNATATSGLSVSYSSSSTLAGIVGTNILTNGVGVVTITASQVGNGAYMAATPIAAVLTITKANLTITSFSAMQTYGDNSTFTGTLLGVVNNDVLTQVFVNQSMQNVGVIANGITTNANGSKIANYNRIFNQGTLTIVAANLTVTGKPLTTTYGQPIPAFTSTGIGFKNFDNLNGGININYGIVPANSNAGTYEYAVSLSGPDLGNYNVTTVAGVLTINKANLSVIGNNFSKTYGTNNPTFTTVNTGITNGDVLSVTIAPLATNTGVGIYNLPFDVSVSGIGLVNYNLTTMAGVLTITKANLTVTAQSFSRIINRANPVFTTNTTGLVAGEMLDINVLTTVTINSPQGVYALRPSVTGATLSNYTLTTVAGTITVLCTVPSIVGTINASNQCVGVSTTFTANGRGTDIVYTWKNSLGEEVSNASTFTTTMAGVYTVSISGACGSFVYNSSIIKLDTIATPKFLVQPKSTNYCPSTSATLAVTVAGAANGQLRWSNGTNFANNIAVSTPGTYNVTFAGTCGTVISNSVTVNSLVGTAIVGTPAAKSVCEGTSIGLVMTALGDNIAYKWSNGSTDATNNFTVSGLSSTTYTVTVSGTCGTQISSDIIITPISAVKINGISSSATICGDNLPYALDANFSGDGISYKWSNGVANSSTFVNTGGNYYLTVTGTCGSYISSAIGINVTENTRIVTAPVAVTACEGSVATFTVSAVGGNLSYVWNGDANTNATTYTTTATGSNILVRVSGTCGIVNSNVVNYTGILKTVIQSAPQSQVLSSANDLRNINVFAQGDQLSYKWSSGEITSQIMNKGAGTYTVTVTGTCGNEIRSAILTLPTTAAVVSGINVPTDLTTITSPIIVSILGSGFITGATVTVGGVALTNVVVSGNVLTGTIPAGSVIANPSNPTVLVQNFGAPVALPTTPPIVVVIDPSKPVVANVSSISTSADLSNTTLPIVISIIGSGFQNGATITVGGVVLTNVTVTGNVITGTIPAGSTIINPSNPVVIVQNVGAPVAVPVVPPVVITATNVASYQSTSFSIFPNPTSNGEFRIESPLATEGGIVEIFNAQGSVVYTQKILSAKADGYTLQIDANLVSGIYLVKIRTASVKLVVY